MKAIPFFTDDIAIIPHSATLAEHLGKPITIREFAGGRPVSLYELENGELRAVVRMPGQGGMDDFVEGPEDNPPRKLSLIYLDTCLPDYFNGFTGHTYAVPLSRKPRNHEVKRGLLDEIGANEVYVDGAPIAEHEYDELRDEVARLFADAKPLASWSKTADDLSESYAYFGVQVS